MDLSDPKTFGFFLDLYGNLPRAAPGSETCTSKALALLPPEPRRTVLDLGCGPGAQTLTLARALPDSALVALDLLPSMAARTRDRCSEPGVKNRIAVTVADMAVPPVPPASQDLIWCEGAIYNLGVTEALLRWKPLLSGNGCVGFTEPVWLQTDPDDEIRRWWSAEYPAITDISGVSDAVAEAGFEMIAWFTLPPEAWWMDYYGPLEIAIAEFLEANPEDETAVSVAASAEEEIAMLRRHGASYSYGFFVVRQTSPHH
jgi:SAM-dependent methyltransferase